MDDEHKNYEQWHRELLARRAEEALLSLLGYRDHEGLWLTPEGVVLEEGHIEALEEACAEVELGHVTVHRPPATPGV